jgi:DNA-binding NarL/FixJ family response regulator
LSYEIILNELISNISHPLKSGLELELALKAKLTKKELKLLKALNNGLNKEDIQKELNFNEQEFLRVNSNLVKKLNQEKVKQALYNI